MSQVTAEASVMTKMTAPDMPMQESNFCETPRKGQIARNWTST